MDEEEVCIISFIRLLSTTSKLTLNIGSIDLLLLQPLVGCDGCFCSQQLSSAVIFHPLHLGVLTNRSANNASLEEAMRAIKSSLACASCHQVPASASL